ncbi:MAG TPA: hypothetical protein VHG52_05115 [Thermomicrobiales bacterium]|nr:hypothetical protein [Thermomicrobiales bacterium]
MASAQSRGTLPATNRTIAEEIRIAMAQPDEQKQRRQRILITLQIVRFVVAGVMLALSIYFEDVLLGLLAIGFLILGTATTWLRLRDNDRSDGRD